MMDMWTFCEKYPAYYNLQHCVTYNSNFQWNILIQPLHTYTMNLSSQNQILLNKYQQGYHIKLYDFPGERGKFLLPDISAILNLISVLENSREVPASWNCNSRQCHIVLGLTCYQPKMRPLHFGPGQTCHQHLGSYLAYWICGHCGVW